MSRNICVFQNFMNEEYEGMIRSAAEKAGFGVRFFTEAQFDEAAAFLPECEILYAQALLAADLPIEDTAEYTDLVCSLL